MKKTLLFAFILALASALSAAPATTTSSMRVSAFKDEVVDPTISSTFTIRYFDNTEITGVTQFKDISERLTEGSTSIAGAFSINIVSNAKATIPISLTFSPFVSQTDTSDKVPLTYSMTPTVTKTAGDTRIRVNNNNQVTNSGKTYYFYAYTPSYTLTGENVTGGNTVNVPAAGTTATLTYKPDKNVFRYKSSSNTPPNVNDINDDATMPSSTSDKLPGFNNNKLSSTATFALSMTSENYAAMEYFENYIATVRVEISMN